MAQSPQQPDRSPNRRHFILGGGALAVSGCTPWESRSFDYLLRVKLTANGVPVESSTVVHLGFHANLGPKIDAVGEYTILASGEAAVLATPNGPIFALLNHPAMMPGFGAREGYIVIYEALWQSMRTPMKSPSEAEVLRAMKYLTGPVDVPSEKWPVLVKFRDLKNPKTVVLAQTDDPSLTIKAVTVERTSQWRNHRINAYLPWLGGLKTSLSGDSFMSNGTLSQQLNRRNFEMSWAEIG